MNLENLRTELSQQLAMTSNSSFWTDTVLNLAINKAQKKLALKKPFNFLVKKTTIPTVIDQDNYDLPTDYLFGGMIWMEVDDTDYGYVSFPRFRDDNFDLDEVFTIQGKEIYLVPVPTEDDLDIDVWYIKTPLKLTDDTIVSDFPDILQDVLVDYALAVCYQRDGDRAKAKESEDLGDKELKDYWKQAGKIVKNAKKGMDITEFFSIK